MVMGHAACTHRCGVVSYYEWKQEGAGPKQPYYVHLPNHAPLRMASLYDVWHDARGTPVFTFTMCTTPAAERLRWLHDRMPAMLLTDEAACTWLGTDTPLDVAMALLQPCAAQELQWYKVSPRMNRQEYEAQDCAAPMEVAKSRSRPITSFFAPRGKPAASCAVAAKPCLVASQRRESASGSGVASAATAESTAPDTDAPAPTDREAGAREMKQARKRPACPADSEAGADSEASADHERGSKRRRQRCARG